MKVWRGAGLVLVCALIGLGGCKGCEQEGNRGDMIVRSHQLLKQIEQDYERTGQATVFHYTISAPRARVVFVQENSRWWAMLGWTLLQLFITGLCVGLADDKLPWRWSSKLRIGLGLGVAALFAVPIVDVAFKRGLWIIDAEQRTMTCDRTGPIGLFDKHDKRALDAAPIMLASAHVERRESTDEDGNTSVTYVTVTTLDVSTSPSGSYRVWGQDESPFKGGEWGTRAHTVAACRFIAAKLEGHCRGMDAPNPADPPPAEPKPAEPTREPLIGEPEKTPSLQTIPPLKTTPAPKTAPAPEAKP